MAPTNIISGSERESAKLSLAIISLFTIAILLRLVFVWISLTNLHVTSDEASSVLLAKMISRGAFPLLFTGQPYQFPIESYLMAPFVELLPRSPFGARYQAIFLGLLAVWGFFAIARTAFPRGSRWPAILLICFPSAYFLVYQTAYAPPQYAMSLTLAWVSIYAALRSRQTTKEYLFLMIAGFSCGLAISNHMLTVTISAGVFAMVLCSGSVRKSLQGALVFILTCLLGALPYILAVWLVPGAYKNLPASLDFAASLSRIISPALSQTLPGAMGINPILFPDLGGQINWSSSLRSIFTALYVILLLTLIVQRIKAFFSAAAGRSWPRLELVDLALIASLLTIWVFSSHLASSTAYRYMLPAVWCFPFLVGHAFESFTGWYRTSLGFTVICLALFNIAVSVNVILEWNNPKQLEKYSHTPGIEELLGYLKKNDITYCYASFWLAYRITFETDETITCSLPFNERFPLWPIPYKQQVDDQTDPAYILTNDFRPRLSAISFEHHLASSGMTAEKTRVTPFFIYHDFKFPSYLGTREYILDAEDFTIQTNAGNSSALIRLKDKDSSTTWSSSKNQITGQQVTLTFDSVKTVHGITVFHLPNKSDKPKSFQISGYRTVAGIGSWHQLTGRVEAKSELLRFINNHPVYTGSSQQIRFDPVAVEALRIEIVEPQKESRWGLAEIEVNALKASL